MLLTLRGQITIACQPERAFDAVADPRTPIAPALQANVEPLTEGPLGAGSAFVVRQGRTVVGASKILVYDRPRRVVYEEQLAGGPQTHVVEVRAHDDGTFLDYHLEQRTTRWFTPIVLVFRWRTRSNFLRYLDRIKEYCEGPA